MGRTDKNFNKKKIVGGASDTKPKQLKVSLKELDEKLKGRTSDARLRQHKEKLELLEVQLIKISEKQAGS